MNTEQLIMHYLNYGIYEKRTYKIELPNDFNPEVYKELNIELLNLSDEELKVHYIKYGYTTKTIFNAIYI